jgi:hypothetical protein
VAHDAVENRDQRVSKLTNAFAVSVVSDTHEPRPPPLYVARHTRQVALGADKLCMDDPLTCSTEPGFGDEDFCFPAVYTVTASVFDNRRDNDAVISLVRRDDAAGFERVDYLDAQGGSGDVLRGFTIRNNNTQKEWRVTLDKDEKVTGCIKLPRERPELPDCIAPGASFTGESGYDLQQRLLRGNTYSCASYTGQADQAQGEVDFWQALVAPFERVQLVVARNGTSTSDVLRYTRIAALESGHPAYVATELYNYATSPISPDTWALPSECPP